MFSDISFHEKQDSVLLLLICFLRPVAIIKRLNLQKLSIVYYVGGY